jgi:hypothetical protein
MICSVCNKEVENGITICPFCGAFLDEKEEKIVEVCFKKPAPPPVIELSFVEPEPEAEILCVCLSVRFLPLKCWML